MELRMSGRRRRPHTASSKAEFGFPSVIPQPRTSMLVNVTDTGLIGSLLLATGWYGGRTPTGQFLLCVCAVVAAAAWAAYQLTTPERSWARVKGISLWIACGVLLAIQVTDLPDDWRLFLSPKLSSLFPAVPGDVDGEYLPSDWRTLSLAPASTLAAFPVWLSYGLLLITASQRLRKYEDVEQYLRWIGMACAFWALVGLLQYAFHNGRYLWLFESPAALGDKPSNGPFTNKNHYAQFLSLGLGPLVWCVIKAFSEASDAGTGSKSSQFRRLSATHSSVTAVVWTMALSVTVVALVMTLSRGGFVAMAFSLGVPISVFLWRYGVRHAWVVLVLGAAILSTGTLGLDQLMTRFAADGDNGRWPIWSANWQVAQDFPWFGTGVGTHINAHQMHLSEQVIGREYTHAESSVLQVASETGFLGLGIAIAAIVLVLEGLLRTLACQVRPDQATCTAAILGSLLGNIAHAVADFIWYVPGCMAAALLLTACGSRLLPLLRSDQLGVPAARPAMFWGWGLRACCVIVMGCGSLVLAASELRGAADVWRYHQYAWQADSSVNSLDEVDRESFERDKARAAIAAARIRPGDSRMQLAAARVCLRQFERNLQASDTPLGLMELRDAVIASQFKSRADGRAWVMKVTGKNWKLLHAASRFAKRAIQASPLEGRAYLVLAELAFLEEPTGKLDEVLINQALKLRPSDPVVRYDAGLRDLIAGQTDSAVKHWAYTFRWSPGQRPAIANMLAETCTAEVLINQLQPDWESAMLFIAALETAGKTDESQQMRVHAARLATEFAETHPSDPRNEKAWMVAVDSLVLLGRTEESVITLQHAVQQQPQQIQLRKRLGQALLEAGLPGQAMEHFRWVKQRAPDDASVVSMMEQTYRSPGQHDAAQLTDQPLDRR